MTAAERLAPLYGSPDPSGERSFVLAMCLYDLQMYAAAERLYADAVRVGPQAFGYRDAAERLARIAWYREDFRTLEALSPSLVLTGVREPERSRWLWARARRAARDPAWPSPSGPAPPELDALATIPLGQPEAIRAHYLRGVLEHRRGKLNRARSAFLDTVRAVGTWSGTRVTRARAAELDTARDLATFALANLYFEVGRYDEARKLADQIRAPDVRPRAELLAMNAENIDPTVTSRASAASRPSAPRALRGNPPAAADTPRSLLVHRARLVDAPLATWAEAELLVAFADVREDNCGAPGADGLAITAGVMKRIDSALLPGSPDLAAELSRDPTLRDLRRSARIVARERDHVLSQRDTWGARSLALTLTEAASAELADAIAARERVVTDSTARTLKELATQAEIWGGEQVLCCLRSPEMY